MTLNVKQKNYLAAMGVDTWVPRSTQEQAVVTVMPAMLYVQLEGGKRWDGIESPLDSQKPVQEQRDLMLAIGAAISTKAVLVDVSPNITKERVLILGEGVPNITSMLDDRAQKIKLWKYIKSQ